MAPYSRLYRGSALPTIAPINVDWPRSVLRTKFVTLFVPAPFRRRKPALTVQSSQHMLPLTSRPAVKPDIAVHVPPLPSLLLIKIQRIVILIFLLNTSETAHIYMWRDDRQPFYGKTVSSRYLSAVPVDQVKTVGNWKYQIKNHDFTKIQVQIWNLGYVHIVHGENVQKVCFASAVFSFLGVI